MARDYIALDREIDSDSFDVAIKPVVGGFLGDLIKDAKTARRLLAEATTTAADESRQAVARLHEGGMTQTEITDVLKISQQRVSQLLEDARGPRKTQHKHPTATCADAKGCPLIPRPTSGFTRRSFQDSFHWDGRTGGAGCLIG